MPARPSVLCVEDEDPQLELRRLLFESAGFEFVGARTGAEALALFRDRQISVVVLDYWMSSMNGLAVATEMKRQRPSIPVIILSGFAALPGEGAGLVDAWFQKATIEPEELIERVTELIRRKAAHAVE
jgi:DNA-binding response OmpR family regulator